MQHHWETLRRRTSRFHQFATVAALLCILCEFPYALCAQGTSDVYRCVRRLNSKNVKERDAAALELLEIAKPVLLSLDAMHKDSSIEKGIFNRLKKDESVDVDAYCDAIRKAKQNSALALVNKSRPDVKAAVAALRSADPQQSKHIYIFQAYYWPEHDHPEVMFSQKKAEAPDPDEWRYYIEPPEAYTGTWRRWYKSGELMCQTDYMGGKIHGKLVTFLKDGKKALECTFRAGQNEGAWKEWNPSGELICSGTYKNGHRWNGTFKLHTKGSYIIVAYKDGKRVKK